jgi:NADPH:quinone reductase-like Zn-dependent oxidoreductase
VGLHLIRLAAQRGIRTINIVRRESAIAALDSTGADLIFVDSEDLVHRVRKEIGDSHLPLALDAIGGSSCLHLAGCLSKGGKLVNYGFLSGDPCMITPHQAIVSSITLHGFWLVNNLFQGSRQKVEKTYSEITELILAGTISAPVEATYKLEQVQQALAHAGRGGRSGKILFTPNLDV